MCIHTAPLAIIVITIKGYRVVAHELRMFTHCNYGDGRYHTYLVPLSLAGLTSGHQHEHAIDCFFNKCYVLQ